MYPRYINKGPRNINNNGDDAKKLNLPRVVPEGGVRTGVGVSRPL